MSDKPAAADYIAEDLEPTLAAIQEEITAKDAEDRAAILKRITVLDEETGAVTFDYQELDEGLGDEEAPVLHRIHGWIPPAKEEGDDGEGEGPDGEEGAADEAGGSSLPEEAPGREADDGGPAVDPEGSVP